MLKRLVCVLSKIGRLLRESHRIESTITMWRRDPAITSRAVRPEKRRLDIAAIAGCLDKQGC